MAPIVATTAPAEPLLLGGGPPEARGRAQRFVHGHLHEGPRRGAASADPRGRGPPLPMSRANRHPSFRELPPRELREALVRGSSGACSQGGGRQPVAMEEDNTIDPFSLPAEGLVADLLADVIDEFSEEADDGAGGAALYAGVILHQREPPIIECEFEEEEDEEDKEEDEEEAEREKQEEEDEKEVWDGTSHPEALSLEAATSLELRSCGLDRPSGACNDDDTVFEEVRSQWSDSDDDQNVLEKEALQGARMVVHRVDMAAVGLVSTPLVSSPILPCKEQREEDVVEEEEFPDVLETSMEDWVYEYMSGVLDEGVAAATAAPFGGRALGSHSISGRSSSFRGATIGTSTSNVVCGSPAPAQSTKEESDRESVASSALLGAGTLPPHLTAPPSALQPPPPSQVSTSPLQFHAEEMLLEQVSSALHEQLHLLSPDTTAAGPLPLQDLPAPAPTKEPPTAEKASAPAPVPKIKSWKRSISSSRRSTRSKRTVIGASRRTEQASSCPGATVTLRSLASSDAAAAAAHKQWAVPAVCCMDLDNNAAAHSKDVTENAAARCSSLSKAYDALGAEFHRLDTEDSSVECAGWQAASCTDLQHEGLPGRRGLNSAMELDLGVRCSQSGSLTRAGSRTFGRPPLLRPERSASVSGFHVDRPPKSPSSPVCFGGGSPVPVAKRSSSQHTSLPELPRSSSGSIAWTLRRARQDAKRGALAAASVF
mmetsp:Transcript_3697/g.7314  ORF Transcript_3697/g.7314 Transcript_3697/m.7314 type:complete len:713 (+) Transcript_3697:64-2202(+)